MSYEKRVCVMKQIKRGFSADGSALSGAIYAERMGNTLKITPRLLGLAPVRDGRYVIVFEACGKRQCFEYEGGSFDVADAPSIKDGFCALLCFVRAGTAEPVAYGACGKENASAQALVAAVGTAGAEKKKKRPANPLPPTELPSPAPNVPLAPTPIVPDPVPGEDDAPFRDRLAAAYDDEAIATDDYFVPHDENEGAASAHREEKDEVAGGGDPHEDEADAPRPVRKGTLTYYNTVREKLKAAFEKYPRDERFRTVFASSEWVNTGDALLGIVYENGLPRYLCVASEKPFPPETGQQGIFVPYTHFSDEEGAYIVFQDADTGEYITVRDA